MVREGPYDEPARRTEPAAQLRQTEQLPSLGRAKQRLDAERPVSGRPAPAGFDLGEQHFRRKIPTFSGQMIVYSRPASPVGTIRQTRALSLGPLRSSANASSIGLQRSARGAHPGWPDWTAQKSDGSPQKRDGAASPARPADKIAKGADGSPPGTRPVRLSLAFAVSIVPNRRQIRTPAERRACVCRWCSSTDGDAEQAAGALWIRI